MLPQGILDIGWADLGFALCASVRAGDHAEAQARVEAAWSADGEALCALPVRSGLDLLLTALNMPRGGEVLTSALTIEDVPRIIADHGLVAVPFDVDMHTLSLTVESTDSDEYAYGCLHCPWAATIAGSRAHPHP